MQDNSKIIDFYILLVYITKCVGMAVYHLLINVFN